MKIAALQLNYTIGDFSGNASKLIDAYKKAVAAGAQLVVTSEMAITGYPALDLLIRPRFIEDCIDACNAVASQIESVPLIFGGPDPCPDSIKLYNTAFIAQNGAIKDKRCKQLLPTYDVFDEERYFISAAPQPPVTIQNYACGVTICEDIWNDKDFWEQSSYSFDPIENLNKHHSQFIINIAASPYVRGKVELRTKMLKALAQKWHQPILYVNQVGGNDSLLFDGNSMLINADGNLEIQAQSFQEDILIFNMQSLLKTHQTDASIQPFSTTNKAKAPNVSMLPYAQDWEEEVTDALCMGIRDYTIKCGFESVIVGLSGGIDSALVAALATRALGKNHVQGITMPSRYSPDDSPRDAIDLAKNLGIDIITIPIEEIFSSTITVLSPQFGDLPWGITEENLQARIRGLLLMAYSNKTGALLLTTGNKSELAVGYATLYGDMCGGLAVIADVFKTDVYCLAKFINTEAGKELIPLSTLTKEPSAELRDNQKDSDSLPDYKILDGILKLYIEGEYGKDTIVAKGYDHDTATKIIQLLHRAEYKRYQAPPVLKISGRAFGTGRRYPIAQKSPSH